MDNNNEDNYIKELEQKVLQRKENKFYIIFLKFPINLLKFKLFILRFYLNFAYWFIIH